MKNIFVILLFLASCESNEKAPSYSEKDIATKKQTDKADSFVIFAYKLNIKDKNIKNTSENQIDLLFNNLENYIGGQKNDSVKYSLEFCMQCESLVEFNNGLLFNKRLLITNDKIIYYKKDIKNLLNRNEIKLNGNELYDFKQHKRFKFENGDGLIKYQGISCNDANFNKVELRYKTDKIIIDSLINVAYFEYDLNKDGQKEFYLLGSRNCNKTAIF